MRLRLPAIFKRSGGKHSPANVTLAKQLKAQYQADLAMAQKTHYETVESLVRNLAMMNDLAEGRGVELVELTNQLVESEMRNLELEHQIDSVRRMLKVALQANDWNQDKMSELPRDWQSTDAFNEVAKTPQKTIPVQPIPTPIDEMVEAERTRHSTARWAQNAAGKLAAEAVTQQVTKVAQTVAYPLVVTLWEKTHADVATVPMSILTS